MVAALCSTCIAGCRFERQTIHRSPGSVWPWLAQMGSGVAGWYAYDFIDNGSHPSARRILPGFQNVGAGSIMPALPKVKDVFLVVQCEPERSLVLAWKQPNGRYQTTWAFSLTETRPGETRLLVRGRVAPGYRPFGLPQWMTLLLAEPAHFIMERKQLADIAQRAESTPQHWPRALGCVKREAWPARLGCDSGWRAMHGSGILGFL
jgi:hypothetical protein